MSKPAVRVGALGRDLNPQSFMSQEQAYFVDWLLEHAQLVPVTARSTEETARVTLDFNSWKITTHGAVIIKPNGEIDDEWKKEVLFNLRSYSSQLLLFQKSLTHAFKLADVNAHVRIVYEYNAAPIYVIAKHRDSSKIKALYSIADKITASFDLDGFYIHKNNNNISWIPTCINKGRATEHLIKKIHSGAPHTPIIGLGDSVSDFSFLQHCSWFGMPKQSQIQSLLKTQISES